MVLKRIGLTGATGMLGRHLHAALAAAQVETVAASRSPGGEVAGWDLTEWLEPEALDALFPNVQAVIHAGALVQPSCVVDQARIFDANVRSCLNLGLWALEKNLPLVFVSGAIVYADPCAPLQKESATLGWSGLGGLYGFSKLLAEDALMRLRPKGLQLAVIRPSSIYGTGISADKIVPRLLSIASCNGVIELKEPIDDCVDLVHATDVANATLAVVRHECWDILNISSGKPVSFRELAEACLTVTGRGRISLSGCRPADYQPAVKYSLDITRARELIGWRPIISICKGLEMLLRGEFLAATAPRLLDH